MAIAAASHLAPDRCYVCGGVRHSDGTGSGDHKFWPNADAAAHFAREDRKQRATFSPEAAYVAEHRPY